MHLVMLPGYGYPQATELSLELLQELFPVAAYCLTQFPVPGLGWTCAQITKDQTLFTIRYLVPDKSRIEGCRRSSVFYQYW